MLSVVQGAKIWRQVKRAYKAEIRAAFSSGNTIYGKNLSRQLSHLKAQYRHQDNLALLGTRLYSQPQFQNVDLYQQGLIPGKPLEDVLFNPQAADTGGIAGLLLQGKFNPATTRQVVQVRSRH